MLEIVCADVGGTHVRFAIAQIFDKTIRLTDVATMRIADHSSLAAAWKHYSPTVVRQLPCTAVVALACPIDESVIQLTNNSWRIIKNTICSELGIERVFFINDFVAVAHATLQLEANYFRHVTGPSQDLLQDGVTAIVGPGTGLGVAFIIRRNDHYHVVESEGGHVGFAPIDEIDDALLARLRGRFGRVSAERAVSGPALVEIYQTLAELNGQRSKRRSDVALWTAALEGTDRLAEAALERFCMLLGSVAGDVALMAGADMLVIAGGVGARLAHKLPTSGFADRFVLKGRLRSTLSGIPVKVLTYDQPGLLGAAVYYARYALSSIESGQSGSERAV